VNFVGVLDVGPHQFGHLNGYSLRLRVTEVKSANLLWKFGHGETEILAAIKRKACER